MKSIVYTSIFLMILAGCGTETDFISGPAGANGKDGATGAQGSQGNQGAQGDKGDKGDQGNQGSQGNPGATGPQGNPGLPGAPGSNGHNSLLTLTRGTVSTSLCAAGTGLLVKSGLDLNNDNSLANSEVNASSFVCDGVAGAPAPANPYQVVSIIDPCGDAPGIYDEVFLKFSNGTVLASFSDNANGDNTRFSLLPAGSYVTTDGSNCHVSVDGSGNVSW